MSLGYLLSVKELKLSVFGAGACSGRHFDFVYLTPSADFIIDFGDFDNDDDQELNCEVDGGDWIIRISRENPANHVTKGESPTLRHRSHTRAASQPATVRSILPQKYKEKYIPLLYNQMISPY